MPENSLLSAILAFQSEAPKLQKDALNPHFKSRYLSLESLMEHVLPLLNKHGLVWTTLPTHVDGEPALTYRLIHAQSGESIEGTMLLLVAKKDAQNQGSGLTYSRRYSMEAVLGITADEDDDGAAASTPALRSVSAGPVQSTERTVSAKQRGFVAVRAKEKKIPPKALANLVLAAAEKPVREFSSDQEARDWLESDLKKFPARIVNPLLAAIEAHA